MIDVLYITSEYQLNCDIIRIRYRENESLEETRERARRAIRRKAGTRGRLMGLGI